MAPWFYRALESVSMASALSTALTIYPCQIRPSESINADSLKLQLLTARKKEWWPATADSLPQAVYLKTVKHTALVGIEPTTFRSWVQRATRCATETTRPPKMLLTHHWFDTIWCSTSSPVHTGQHFFSVHIFKVWNALRCRKMKLSK